MFAFFGFPLFHLAAVKTVARRQTLGRHPESPVGPARVSRADAHEKERERERPEVRGQPGRGWSIPPACAQHSDPTKSSTGRARE